jgi:hypothetical protein
MRLSRAMLAANISLVYGASAYAASGSADGANALPKERQECRSTMITGSRFVKRVCRTPSEWRKIEESAKAALQEAQAKVQNCTTPSGEAC